MRALLLHLLLAMTALLTPPAAHAELDRTHAAWSVLLRKHVVLQDARGAASRVDYAGFARDREALGAYLAALARVVAPIQARSIHPAIRRALDADAEAVVRAARALRRLLRRLRGRRRALRAMRLEPHVVGDADERENDEEEQNLLVHTPRLAQCLR